MSVCVCVYARVHARIRTCVHGSIPLLLPLTLNQLWDDAGLVNAGANCFSMDNSHTCQGTTLTQTCTVYKCPWYSYYLQSDADQGDCSGLTCTETTGDDADFVRDNTPAMSYSNLEACQGNCVDPTIGCQEDTCERTYTCNASSTCSDCNDFNLPLHLKGIELDATYESGIHTFEFDDAFTTATMTTPAGVVTTATISSWNFEESIDAYAGTWLINGTPRYAQMQAATSGALAQNAYLAISPDANPIQWGQGIKYMHNGTEFALVACEMNWDGSATVSGLGNAISCKI